MEEVFEALRVRKGYGRGLSWEIICRCLIVAAGVIVLGVSAKYSGERYQALGRAAGFAWSDGGVESLFGRMKDAGMAFEGEGARVIPVGKMDMSGIIFRKDVSDMVRGVKVRKVPETFSSYRDIIPAVPSGRMKKNVVERDAGLKADDDARSSTQVTSPARLDSAPVIAPQPEPTSSTFMARLIGSHSTIFSRSGERWYKISQLFLSSMILRYSTSAQSLAIARSSSSTSPSQYRSSPGYFVKSNFIFPIFSILSSGISCPSPYSAIGSFLIFFFSYFQNSPVYYIYTA